MHENESAREFSLRLQKQMADNADLINEEFAIYTVGLCHLSICTTLTDQEKIVDRVNLAHPSGVTPWAIVEEKFATGEPNPCPCDQKPDTHKHYVLTC